MPEIDVRDTAEHACASAAGGAVSPALIVRSLAFNLAFYVVMFVWMLACLPTLVMRRRAIIGMVRAWARFNLRMMAAIAGTRSEFRGLDNIPSGGVIIAAKHQSVWETFALLPLLDDPAFILKRELMWIPLFGWLAQKAGMIPVDRKAGASALADMNRRAAEAVAARRQLVIFPEGTRRAPFAPPAYKMGVAHLARALNVPCIPVALNSGLFWPRRRFLRYPGTIVAEALPPVPPGLSREAFMSELRARLEEASHRLMCNVDRATEGGAERARNLLDT